MIRFAIAWIVVIVLAMILLHLAFDAFGLEGLPQ